MLEYSHLKKTKQIWQYFDWKINVIYMTFGGKIEIPNEFHEEVNFCGNQMILHTYI